MTFQVLLHQLSHFLKDSSYCSLQGSLLGMMVNLFSSPVPFIVPSDILTYTSHSMYIFMFPILVSLPEIENLGMDADL